MKVTVTYFGQVQQIAGVSCEEIEVREGGSVQECLKDVSARRGDRLRAALLTQDDLLHPALMGLVNEVVVSKEGPVRLKDGDHVKLLLAIPGG